MTLDTTIDEGELGHILAHETLAGRYNNGEDILSGTFASRPAASSVEAGTLFWATDTNVLYRSDGATWSALAAGVTDADFLVGTAHAGLSAEIVVGTTPGGELGGSWASPTVDATHSGSSHSGVIATHEAAADPHTGYRLESADHSHLSTGAQGGTVPGADTTAIHDDTAGEISLLTEKTVPVSADLLLIEDSAASNAKKKLQVGNLPTGGAPNYVVANSNTPTDVSEVTDVTVVTRDLSVSATQIIEVDIYGLVVQDSGAVRLWTFTLDFDGAFDLEFTRSFTNVASTSRVPVHISARAHIHSSTLAEMVAFIKMNAAARTSGQDVGVGADQWLEESGWGTTSSDLTGTCTVALKIRSDSATATQTFAVTAAVMRVYSQT